MSNRLHTVARKARAALRRRWVQVVLVLLVLLGGISGTFWTAHHLADSVTITVTDFSAATARTIYTATINDMGKARAVQSIWNDTRRFSLFATFECPASGSLYTYDFRFSFLGIPIQELHGAWGGCGFFRLITLGVTSPLAHAWPGRNTWQQLVQLTGMPDYSHYGQQPG